MVVADEVEHAVSRWLQRLPAGHIFSMSDVLDAQVVSQDDRRHRTQIGKALRACGCVRIELRNASPRYVYRAPR